MGDNLRLLEVVEIPSASSTVTRHSLLPGDTSIILCISPQVNLLR